MEVDVEDNGWGVEPKYRKNLFALFYQVPRENERMQKGYGIGLAQSKLIIEAHGGKIGIKNTITGQGSLFYFTLPLN